MDEVDVLPAHALLKFDVQLAVREGLYIADAWPDAKLPGDGPGKGLVG